MSQASPKLEIPRTLIIGRDKVFSEELAAEERAIHGAAYDEAHLLYEVFQQWGKRQHWVPLPGTKQEVCLDRNDAGPREHKFLHLFGVLEPGDEDSEKAAAGSGIHLVTFSEVQHVAGTRLTAPGVTLDESISDSRQVALPSNTKEFQFTVNALELIHQAAADLGLLATGDLARQPQPA